MNHLHRCLVYVFIFILPAYNYGQIEGPLISYYGRGSYRAGTQNWNITINDHGVVYFANNKGLLEFDGNNWSLYRLPNRTIVRSMDIDSLGNIFVGGQNEIGVFRNENGKMMEYESLTHLIPEDQRDFEDVWETFSVGNKRIYCSEKAVFINEKSEVKTILPFSGRFENYFELNGEIYLQDSQTGLYKLEGETLNRILGPESFQNDRVIGMAEFPDKTLLITQEKGLHNLVNDTLLKLNSEASELLSTHKAYTSLKLKNGNVLIGTVLNGLAIIDKNGKVLKTLNKEDGLDNNTILCAYEDSAGNLWLGLDNGINEVELNSPFNFINSINGLEGTGYTAFRYDENIYLGTNQGLFVKNRDSQNYTLFSKKASQIWGHSVIDKNHYVHAHEGTFLLKDAELRQISNVQGSWKLIELRKRPGILLEGTYEGFFVYRKKENEAPELIGRLNGFSESSRIFEEDEDGNIWISHAYRGLFKIKLNSAGTAIEDVKKFNSDNGLPDDLYLTVSKTRGEIVFTTSEGIYKFNKESERFEPHEGLSELIGKDANVLRIVEDELGNVWFCTESEFGQISITPSGVYNEVEVTYLNAIQEDLVDGFEDVFTLNESVAFIPVESGFIKYDTKRELRKDFNHSLMIRGVYQGFFPDSLLASGSEQKKAVNFSPRQNSLVFRYVVPAYRSLNNIKYQYRLVGLEDQWSKWTSSTRKEFDYLKPGDYKFQVRAMNSFKTQSPTTEFRFSILPPWYLSKVAKVVYVALVLFVLYMLYRLIKMREVKKRLLLQKESQGTIKRKDEELQRISEKSENEIMQLRNEKLKADINHKNSELASTTMHLVQKSEILQKIKEDLSDLSETAGDDTLQNKIKQIERAIDADVRLDKNWERFESHFDQVHENFFKNLRKQYPNLTPKDQKLCAYLRMNLSTKEIAPLLNISVRGVEISRYRLRKKLNLQPEDNLVSFIMEV
mgnify:CR=1 FL=1